MTTIIQKIIKQVCLFLRRLAYQPIFMKFCKNHISTESYPDRAWSRFHQLCVDLSQSEAS